MSLRPRYSSRGTNSSIESQSCYYLRWPLRVRRRPFSFVVLISFHLVSSKPTDDFCQGLPVIAAMAAVAEELVLTSACH